MSGYKLVGLAGADPKGHVAEGRGPECRLALAPGPSWAQSPRPGRGPHPAECSPRAVLQPLAALTSRKLEAGSAGGAPSVLNAGHRGAPARRRGACHMGHSAHGLHASRLCVKSAWCDSGATVGRTLLV